MSTKIYYAVYTSNEKIWVRADLCETTNGCLTFYDIEEDGTKIVISSFGQGYWRYVYEADIETGESIADQIPFWKPHKHVDAPDRKGLPHRTV